MVGGKCRDSVNYRLFSLTAEVHRANAMISDYCAATAVVFVAAEACCTATAVVFAYRESVLCKCRDHE